MLSAKKEKKKILEPGTAQNRINEGTIFKGDISSEGFFRIDGHIEGSIQTPTKVVIGKSGIIIGHLKCDHADIEGRIEGSLEVLGTLTIRATAQIDGELTVGKLAVEPGAIINASCLMSDKKIKTLNTKEKAVTEKKMQDA